ncbi:MAG: dipeptidase [Thermoanaerobaculia bacterium]|nr:dipeptidase [Thermoanaerobaculia bacterium]
MHRNFCWIGAAAMLALLLACSDGEPTAEEPEESLEARAERLAGELIVVDTHIDVPYRLEEEEVDISQRTDGGDFDYPRAVEGGLDVAFMSIYVPASLQETGGAKEKAEALIDRVRGFAERWPEKFAIATSVTEVREQFGGAPIVSLPMRMENGAPIGEDLANLAHFHARGIRNVTLTHSENNQICDSSYASDRRWDGLSPFGREVVAEMNRLGVMIDVSHVSDDTFWQVIELTAAPVIASHSSCRKLTPGFERNMSDEMIRALAENGGVIQINFGSAFLTAEANEYSREMYRALGAYQEEQDLADGDPALEIFRDEYRAENPYPYADIADVVAHIDHVVDLAGVDHVGLGSDFDGVGDSLPTGLKDVSDYPNLIYELLVRGYSEEEIAKICGENLLRVWSEVERVAAELQATESTS